MNEVNVIKVLFQSAEMKGIRVASAVVKAADEGLWPTFIYFCPPSEVSVWNYQAGRCTSTSTTQRLFKSKLILHLNTVIIWPEIRVYTMLSTDLHLASKQTSSDELRLF